MRRLLGSAVAAVTLLVLTGCDALATGPEPTITVVPSSSAPSMPDPTKTVTASPEPVSTPVVQDSDRPVKQCADDTLGVSVAPDPGGSGAGSIVSEVLFVNTGGEACQLRGTPGVSVISDGKQVGPAAARDQTAVTTITLRPGDTVASLLRVVNISPGGGPLDRCTVVKGDGYRVYPPHSTKSFTVAEPSAVACVDGPSFMTVYPVKTR